MLSNASGKPVKDKGKIMQANTTTVQSAGNSLSHSNAGMRSAAAATELRARKELFETLILPHESSLFGPAMALTRSASDAEDLVQDTMLRAFDRFETFRADGSPRAWLHTIMRNLFFNAYRKKSREPKQVSLEFFEPATASLGGGAVGISGAVAPQQPTVSSPERQVLSQMEGAAVLGAVKSLPTEYRSVVVLADIQGLPYQEIADRLEIPVGTVRSRLSRGRERVRRAVFAWRPSTETASPRIAGAPLPA
jgi:RNA polymerase sigma-70 factor (ECF subfamily)